MPLACPFIVELFQLPANAGKFSPATPTTLSYRNYTFTDVADVTNLSRDRQSPALGATVRHGPSGLRLRTASTIWTIRVPELLWVFTELGGHLKSMIAKLRARSGDTGEGEDFCAGGTRAATLGNSRFEVGIGLFQFAR